MDKDSDQKIQTLAQWLYEAKYPVVFSGAGISTESGLPDFRGPNGLWTRQERGLPPPAMSRPWEDMEPNKLETPYDSYANLRFSENIGEVMPRVIKRLKSKMGYFE